MEDRYRGTDIYKQTTEAPINKGTGRGMTDYTDGRTDERTNRWKYGPKEGLKDKSVGE